MSTLFWIGIVFHVALCFFLVLLILVQNDKGGGLGSLAGGAGNASFSSAGAATFIQKLTRGVAIAFMGIVFALSLAVSRHDANQGVVESSLKKEAAGMNAAPQGNMDLQGPGAPMVPNAPATAEEVPAAPAPAGE